MGSPSRRISGFLPLLHLFFHQQEGWRLTLHCSGNLQNGRGCNRAADMRSFDLGIVSFFALAWVISSLWVVTPHRGPLWELIVRIFFSTMPLLFINGLLSSFYCKLYMGLCWFLSVYERMRIKIGEPPQRVSVFFGNINHDTSVRNNSSSSQSLLQHLDSRIWCKHKKYQDPSCLVSMVQAAAGAVMVWGIFLGTIWSLWYQLSII